MKLAETSDGDIVAVDLATMKLEYDLDEIAITCTSAVNLEPVLLFCPFDLDRFIRFSVGFDMACDANNLCDHVMELIRSRLAARLMAEHIPVVHNDHYEAVLCVLLEQERYLRAVDTIAEDYTQDWRSVVATRVTGHRFVQISSTGGVRVFVRHPSDESIMVPTSTSGIYDVLLCRDRANTTIYTGRKSACQAALRFLEAYPGQEAVTSIQLERWIARHEVPGERDEPVNPPAPSRSIVLPADTSVLQVNVSSLGRIHDD